MNTLSRRGYLAASAAALATIHVPRVAMAQAAIDPGQRFA